MVTEFKGVFLTKARVTGSMARPLLNHGVRVLKRLPMASEPQVQKWHANDAANLLSVKAGNDGWVRGPLLSSESVAPSPPLASPSSPPLPFSSSESALKAGNDGWVRG
jgi:hypothetical protein